jgi:hypothetical protein
MSRSLWWRNKKLHWAFLTIFLNPLKPTKTVYVTDTTAARILWQGLPTLEKGNSRQHKILPLSRILSELVDLSFLYQCEWRFECSGYYVVATRKTLQSFTLIVLRSSWGSVLLYIWKENSMFIRGSGKYLAVNTTKHPRRLEFSVKIQCYYTW